MWWPSPEGPRGRGDPDVRLGLAIAGGTGMFPNLGNRVLELTPSKVSAYQRYPVVGSRFSVYGWRVDFLQRTSSPTLTAAAPRGRCNARHGGVRCGPLPRSGRAPVHGGASGTAAPIPGSAEDPSLPQQLVGRREPDGSRRRSAHPASAAGNWHPTARKPARRRSGVR